MPQLASAYDFKVDGLCYNINDDGTSVTVTWEICPYYESANILIYNITSYSDLSGNIVIPEQVAYNNVDYTVTAITPYCFNICTNLDAVEIPESIISIGEKAFNQCKKLKSVTIPSSTISIGTNPFCDCPAIETIAVEAGNPKFDSRQNCNAIILTSSNTLISGCQNTKIPYGVKTIDEYAFYGTEKLEGLVIPNSVTIISDFAFCNSNIITEVFRIPNSVEYIGKYAFSGLTEVYTIIIGESTQYIGSRAFGTNNTTNDTIRVVCLAETPPYLDWTFYKPHTYPFYDLRDNEVIILYVPDVDLYLNYGSVDTCYQWDWGFNAILPLSEFDGDIYPMIGDVNCDGNVTSADVTALYNYLLNADETFVATSDVDGDGNITAADITTIYNFLLGN